MARKTVKTIDSIEALYSKYDKNNGVVRPPQDLNAVDPKANRLKTPFTSMDVHLGGGPKMGAITTYSGLFSTSKTSMCLEIAGANPDKSLLFIDGEFEWTDASYVWAKEKFGIEPDKIKVLQPEHIEEAGEMILDACNIFDIIILDGFSSVGPTAELQGSMEDKQMGESARQNNKFFKKVRGKLFKTNTTLLITNRLYDNIGNVFEPIVEPGGKGIGFYPSQKLWLTLNNVKDDDKVVTGQKVNVNIKKDKVFGNRGGKFTLYYDNNEGFLITRDLVETAKDFGVLEASGSWIKYKGESLAQGTDKAVELLKDNPELYNEIKAATLDAAAELKNK